MAIGTDVQKGLKRAMSLEFFVAALVVTLVVLWYVQSTLPGAEQVRRFVMGGARNASG